MKYLSTHTMIFSQNFLLETCQLTQGTWLNISTIKFQKVLKP